MARRKRSKEINLLLALRHPMRRAILCEMEGEETISPRDLAAILDHPLSSISYHVRVLADCGAVTLVKTKPAHGSMQHFYCMAIEAPWAREALGLDPAGDRPSPGETSTDSET